MRKFIFLNFVLLFSFNAIGWSQTPSAFEIGRQVGNNFARSSAKVRDQNTIQNILNEVSYSQNPEDIQRAICKVLSQVSPERQSAVIDYLLASSIK